MTQFRPENAESNPISKTVLDALLCGELFNASLTLKPVLS